MEECVIILGQGQKCSKDRFSQTKRALTVRGMAEPRGQGDIFWQISKPIKGGYAKFQKALVKIQKVNKHNEVLQCYQFIKVT
jgi:hypothetical protein